MTSQRALPDSPVVGLVGLGIMGRPMTMHLLRGLGSERVHVTTRTKASAQEALDAGAQWHDNARGVGEACDVVILMVTDLADVDLVLDGPDGLLAGVSGRSVVVISSTVSPEGVRALGVAITEHTDGLVGLVDAPVSGGEEGAIEGSLSVMLGGTDDDVAAVLPLFELMGTAVHLGPLGAGQVAKACNQMIVAATTFAVGEASVVADRAGLDLAKLFDLLGGGYAGSRVLEVKKDRLANRDYEPGSPARFMIKDLSFAIEEAVRTGTPTPQTDLMHATFEDLTDRGLGDQDTAVVRAYLEQVERSE